MLGGHTCYKETGSRKRKFQSGRIGGAGWGLVFSMVLSGGLLEKVTFTRDLKLGRARTAWVSWGTPQGAASTGPLLYPTLSSWVRFTGPALFTAPLLALQCECQNLQGQMLRQEGRVGVEKMNSLSWNLPAIWGAIASNPHSRPRKKDEWPHFTLEESEAAELSNLPAMTLYTAELGFKPGSSDSTRGPCFQPIVNIV